MNWLCLDAAKINMINHEAIWTLQRRNLVQRDYRVTFMASENSLVFFWWNTSKNHYSDITWAPWYLKSVAPLLCVHRFSRLTSNKTLKIHITGPLWGKSTRASEIVNSFSGNNTNVRHSDMADKMSSKSEKLSNLPDKMSEECYGTKIVISHHQLLLFSFNKTIQTTFHYGRKWRLLTAMAYLITNAAFKLFKSVHTHGTILQPCQLKCLP